MSASPAAVAVAQEVLDCERATDAQGHDYCAAHWFGWLSDRDCCPRAERVADAVSAIAAREALEEFADELEQHIYPEDVFPRPTLEEAKRDLNLLRKVGSSPDRYSGSGARNVANIARARAEASR